MPKHWRDNLVTEPADAATAALALTEIEMLLIRQQIGPGAIYHGLNLGYQFDRKLCRALHALAQADQDAARPARLVRPDLLPPPDHGSAPHDPYLDS